MTSLMGPHDSIRFFPGDPPVYETLGTLSLLGLGVLVAAGFLATVLMSRLKSARGKRVVSRLIVASCLGLLAVFMVSTFGILRRHFGEWAQLRALLIEHSEKVERAHEERGAVSFAAIEMGILASAPEFKFSELRDPVRLRIMQTTPPYVGVDFGEGANAVFDPKTMICLYSD